LSSKGHLDHPFFLDNQILPFYNIDPYEGLLKQDLYLVSVQKWLYSLVAARGIFQVGVFCHDSNGQQSERRSIQFGGIGIESVLKGIQGGFFISFEGIEGCGKTTQMNLLGDFLDTKGYKTIRTREPGGTNLGDALRKVLLDSDHQMLPLTELFLYEASRHQHVEEVIRPALGKGYIILCDRYSDATFAYQGYGRGLDKGMIAEVDEWASKGLKPDLTFLLDCPVHIGLGRSWARLREEGKDKEEARFEKEGRGFHGRVRKGYLRTAKAFPDRIKVLDGSLPKGTVRKEVQRITLERLALATC